MEALVKIDLGGEPRFDWRAKGLVCDSTGFGLALFLLTLPVLFVCGSSSFVVVRRRLIECVLAWIALSRRRYWPQISPDDGFLLPSQPATAGRPNA